MSLTHADYERAVDGIAGNLRALGDDLVSGYVYGSTVRGEHRPGRSDIDFVAFVRERVLEERDRFVHLVAGLEKASADLVAAGFPIDGNAWYSLEELSLVPPSFLWQFSSEVETRLLAGEPLPSVTDTRVPPWRGLHEFDQTWVFPCTEYLAVDDLSAQQCDEIAGSLDFIRKYACLFACAALGTPCPLRDAPAVLARHFPSLDLSILAEARAMRDSGTVPGPADAKRLMKKALELVEDLEREIDARPRP